MNDESIIFHPDIPHARATQSTLSSILKVCLAPLVAGQDHIVDVGCGTGAVIQWLLDRDVGVRITGIEIAPDVAEHAKKRFADHANVLIIKGDAMECMLPDPSLVFMFAPFDYLMMQKFADFLLTLKPRFRVLHVGREGAAFFLSDGWITLPMFPAIMDMSNAKEDKEAQLMVDPDTGKEVMAKAIRGAQLVLRSVYIAQPIPRRREELGWSPSVKSVEPQKTGATS